MPTLILAILFAVTTLQVAAEQFGAISVSTQPLTSGETYHGYREYRVLLENHSAKDAHRVTLVYPDRAFGYGNSISRIARTVSLAPGTRAIVPLWQPPLPQNGSGQLRVMVDGERPESISLPGNSHMTHSGGGALIPATVLVSRTLNYDELTRALKMESTAYAATMAIGPRDSGTRRGVVATAWSPDSSGSGPHWLELDYATPIKADRVSIYETMGFPATGDIVLTGISGTNYHAIPMHSTGPTRPGTGRVFSFPVTVEPIKTVRLNFGSTYAGMISIDAVELEGPGGVGGVWASAARASSESTAGVSYPSSPGMSGREANRLLRAELPVGEWSQSWLSYTPFDAIALTAGDLRAMPAAIQDALWRYTECGGNLVLFGNASIPSGWLSARRNPFPDGEVVDAGLGRCFLFKTEKIPGLAADSIKLLTDTLSGSTRNWQSLPDEGSAGQAFPVVENVRIPVRGMVIIMLAFVIVIGPVNIIYLSRTNRRTWLLWTIPAISFVTSLIVFAYSFLREGITPDVRIEGLTLLDQANRRAATVGTTAFYCPLTPGGGLFFSSDTEATPLVERADYSRGTDREMDWTQGQNLTRGWVSARVPAYFGLRKAETRRERIQTEGTGQQTSIVNGLGAPIRSLWYADKSGHIFSATNIPAGQKARLAVFSETPKVTQRLGARALSE
ncbi:MAG: hypothetical protein H7Y43_00465, partial [Akkermansiaceae bacterium]|nr:hypothetical protein [Verrucomicrobiales bacterium]